jgi:pimeloyl-ACP methyl ester carboxylesterase
MSAILLGEDLVHYETLGRGKPVLFLHGWVGSWRYLIPAMQVVSVGYRAYAIDLFGFGGSAKNGRYTIQDQAGLLAGFIEKLGIEQVSIVGHGLGALAGLYLALSHPGSVERIMAASFPLEAGMASNRLRDITPYDLTNLLLKESAFMQSVLADAAKADQQAVRQSLASLNGHFTSGQIAETETACLLVHGSADPLVQAPRPDQLNGMPVHSHSFLFEKSGHFPMLDDSRKFNRLMIDYLNLPAASRLNDLQVKDEWKRQVR